MPMRTRMKPVRTRIAATAKPASSGPIRVASHSTSPSSRAVIEAVRAAGKQGELGVAEIPVRVIRALDLRIVPTPGGTPDPAVNALHVEVRLPGWRRLALWVRRRSVADYFNERITPVLAEAAKPIEAEG